MAIDREEKLANPNVGTLVTPESAYRREMVSILMRITVDNIARLPEAQRNQIAKGQIRSLHGKLRNEPTSLLEKKIAAIQVQNPGALVKAMREQGYTIEGDGLGGIRIATDEGLSSGMGRHVTKEEFEAMDVDTKKVN